MKQIYVKSGKIFRTISLLGMLTITINAYAQQPTTVTNGICTAVIADFNTNDNGFNSPSIYGSIFDSSFYYNATRGYWTDYLPPLRVVAPGFPRVLDIISPPYVNPNATGTFNIGFYYIIPNPAVDRFQVRIISVTPTPNGTVTNVEATSGTQFFSSWSSPSPYVDATMGIPPTTPFMVGFQGNICIKLLDPDITNAPGTTYRVEVAYIVNEPFFAVFDDLSIGNENAPLPVDFIGLVAKRNNDAVDLKWDVTDEVNVAEYQVEKSTNGTSFSSVGSVSAKGKSIYTFTNYNVGSNNLYYRIKSVDIDGRYKYSGVIRLTGSNSYSNKLTLYPVPVKGDATLEHKLLSANAKITISSIEGKILKVIIPSAGSSHTPVRLSGITPGTYILRLDDGQGNVETTKFVKE